MSYYTGEDYQDISDSQVLNSPDFVGEVVPLKNESAKSSIYRTVHVVSVKVDCVFVAAVKVEWCFSNNCCKRSYYFQEKKKSLIRDSSLLWRRS